MEIYVKVVDKNFVFRNSLIYGGDIKIEIYNVKCMCDQLSKLEIGKKLYFYNSFLYLMEFEINLIKE